MLDSMMFRVPVLVEGDRGSGKTYEAHAFARQNDLPLIEMGGHEGVEAIDLLGTYTPMADRTLVWKDGPLSQAFRRASKGTPTMLLVDELLRIPTRQQSVLLTALSPIDGYYRLRTGRIVNVDDGVGEEEVLRCKVEHLAIVATTNVGADYALDNLDPAIAERWMILRKDTSEESLRAVLSEVVSAKGYGLGTTNRLVRFFLKAKELRNAGQIARLPTTRTLVRAVELAGSEDEVGTMLLNQSLLWVERDLEGYPVKEQIESIRSLVDGIFPGSTGRALL
jgi:midasin (ATPase involved in ribosome maturation)